jgi:hypothetical protein
VKLGKNASDTCAMLSEAYGEEVMKKSSISECHEYVEDDEVVVQDLTELMKMLKKCGIWCIQTDEVSEL